MKRYKVWILVAVLLALFVVCNTKYDTEYRLLKSEDEIVGISIIELNYEHEDYRMLKNTICEIENISSFLSGLKGLPCKAKYGTILPTHLHGDAVGIKIDYTDGSYELIDWRIQFKYDPVRDGIYSASLFRKIFDEQQFLAFLAQHMVAGGILSPLKK